MIYIHFKKSSKDVGLLSLFVMFLQNSSFVFVFLSALLYVYCFKVLVIIVVILDEQIREPLLAATGRPPKAR